MRIAYSNIVDALDASHLSAYSVASGYPVANTQDQRLSTRWRADTSATAQTVTVELDTFPEYPDSATGTTYIQDAWATVDGWASGTTGTASTPSSGVVRLTANGSGTLFALRSPAFTYTGPKTMRCRIRASKAGTIAWRTTISSVNYDVSISVTTDWKIFDIIETGTGALSQALFVCTGFTTSGDWFEIDWIYIGDGTYTTTLPDISGNGNHGTVYGAVATDGLDGRALSFDSTNDYVSMGDVCNITGAITVAHWVKRTGTIAALLGMTIGKWITSSANRSYALASHATLTNRLRFALSNDGTNFTGVDDTSDLPLNTWTHVAGIFVPNEGLYFYRDGAQVAFLATSYSSIFNGTATLRINSGVTGTNYYPFNVDIPRIYSRALSAAEIEHLYNMEPWVGEYDGLAGYWKLDDGLGVNTVAIMGHNILPGTQVKIQANNSDNWGYPEVDEVLTVNRDTILKFLTSTATYKYWRFYFYGQGSIEAGRLWLGEYETIDPSSLVDFKVSKKRSDIVSYGKDRQKYATPGYSWRRIELSFPPTEETMIKRVSDLYDAVGNHSSLIFCNFDTIRDYQLVEPMYCSIDGEVGFDYGKLMLATYSLKLEEDR